MHADFDIGAGKTTAAEQAGLGFLMLACALGLLWAGNYGFPLNKWSAPTIHQIHEIQALTGNDPALAGLVIHEINIGLSEASANHLILVLQSYGTSARTVEPENPLVLALDRRMNQIAHSAPPNR